jgi:hypothetical protein
MMSWDDLQEDFEIAKGIQGWDDPPKKDKKMTGMTVKELKNALKGVPGDMLVVLAGDAEGNKYSPMRECEPAALYVPDSSYGGEVWSEDDAEEYEVTDTVRAVVLWPTN